MPRDKMSSIYIEGLSKTFRGKRGGRVAALSGLNLSIQAGEVFGFLGPNGAGKSTTIKSLMGLILPTSGEAFLDGVSVRQAQARQNVGYLPENPSFYDFLSAREYLSFVGSSFGMGKAACACAADQVLERVQLSEASRRPIRTYSKGMVQRLGIAQALLHDPDIYILDEPMSGLDPLGRALVKEIILDLRQRGKTVFFSTHITADVERICDRVGIIVGGVLRREESVVNLLRHGVNGYAVSVRGEQTVPGFEPQRIQQGVGEYQVSSSQLGLFMENVGKASNLSVELVEPRRKDLEAFFLETVAGSA